MDESVVIEYGEMFLAGCDDPRWENLPSSLSDELHCELCEGHPLTGCRVVPIAYCSEGYFRDRWNLADADFPVLFLTDNPEFPLARVDLIWQEAANGPFPTAIPYQNFDHWTVVMRQEQHQYHCWRDAWVALESEVQDLAWDRFTERFQFAPNYFDRVTPAIHEPEDSIVLDLSGVFAPMPDGRKSFLVADVDSLDGQFLAAFRSLIPANGFMYVLDWQHAGYQFRPHIDLPEDRWPLSVFPNGDYYLFLAPDLSFGTFWPPLAGVSVCVREIANRRLAAQSL